jgi:hypothetical protein
MLNISHLPLTTIPNLHTTKRPWWKVEYRGRTWNVTGRRYNRGGLSTVGDELGAFISLSVWSGEAGMPGSEILVTVESRPDRASIDFALVDAFDQILDAEVSELPTFVFEDPSYGDPVKHLMWSVRVAGVRFLATAMMTERGEWRSHISTGHVSGEPWSVLMHLPNAATAIQMMVRAAKMHVLETRVDTTNAV